MPPPALLVSLFWSPPKALPLAIIRFFRVTFAKPSAKITREVLLPLMVTFPALNPSIVTSFLMTS
jgi:hypothetical protein